MVGASPSQGAVGSRDVALPRREQRQQAGAQHQPRRDLHGDRLGAAHRAQHEAGGDHEHLDDGDLLERHSVEKLEHDVGSDGGGERQPDRQRERDPCHEQNRGDGSAAGRGDTAACDGPVALDRMSPVARASITSLSAYNELETRQNETNARRVIPRSRGSKRFPENAMAANTARFLVHWRGLMRRTASLKFTSAIILFGESAMTCGCGLVRTSTFYRTNVAETMNLRRAISGIIIAGLGSVLIYAALAFFTDAPKMATALRTFPLPVFAIMLLLSAISFVVRGIRWGALMRTIGYPVSAKDAIYLQLSGQTMSVTPGRVGEVLKPWLASNIACTFETSSTISGTKDP